MIQEGEGHWPNSWKNLQKARNLWVLRTPQNNKEEGARAKKLVTCGTRSPFGRGQSVPFKKSSSFRTLRKLHELCDAFNSNYTSRFHGEQFIQDFELELELIQTQMAQKPMLRAEVGMRVRCANKASAE